MFIFLHVKEIVFFMLTIKKWRRKFKIAAIEKMNPTWRDLYYELL